MNVRKMLTKTLAFLMLAVLMPLIFIGVGIALVSILVGFLGFLSFAGFAEGWNRTKGFLVKAMRAQLTPKAQRERPLSETQRHEIVEEAIRNQSRKTRRSL